MKSSEILQILTDVLISSTPVGDLKYYSPTILEKLHSNGLDKETSTAISENFEFILQEDNLEIALLRVNYLVEETKEFKNEKI